MMSPSRAEGFLAWQNRAKNEILIWKFIFDKWQKQNILENYQIMQLNKFFDQGIDYIDLVITMIYCTKLENFVRNWKLKCPSLAWLSTFTAGLSSPLLISTGFLKYQVSLDNFSISKFSVWEDENSISVLTFFCRLHRQ